MERLVLVALLVALCAATSDTAVPSNFAVAALRNQMDYISPPGGDTSFRGGNGLYWRYIRKYPEPMNDFNQGQHSVKIPSENAIFDDIRRDPAHVYVWLVNEKVKKNGDTLNYGDKSTDLFRQKNLPFNWKIMNQPSYNIRPGIFKLKHKVDITNNEQPGLVSKRSEKKKHHRFILVGSNKKDVLRRRIQEELIRRESPTSSWRANDQSILILGGEDIPFTENWWSEFSETPQDSSETIISSDNFLHGDTLLKNNFRNELPEAITRPKRSPQDIGLIHSISTNHQVTHHGANAHTSAHHNVVVHPPKPPHSTPAATSHHQVVQISSLHDVDGLVTHAVIDQGLHITSTTVLTHDKPLDHHEVVIPVVVKHEVLPLKTILATDHDLLRSHVGGYGVGLEYGGHGAGHGFYAATGFGLR